MVTRVEVSGAVSEDAYRSQLRDFDAEQEEGTKQLLSEPRVLSTLYVCVHE